MGRRVGSRPVTLEVKRLRPWDAVDSQQQEQPRHSLEKEGVRYRWEPTDLTSQRRKMSVVILNF